jgi:hypothetical protein
MCPLSGELLAGSGEIGSAVSEAWVRAAAIPPGEDAW